MHLSGRSWQANSLPLMTNNCMCEKFFANPSDSKDLNAIYKSRELLSSFLGFKFLKAKLLESKSSLKAYIGKNFTRIIAYKMPPPHADIKLENYFLSH